MPRPMTPDQAREELATWQGYIPVEVAHRALETIAAMTVQEDWRLVDPFTNGGAYEKRRYTRMVSEWVADEGTP